MGKIGYALRCALQMDYGALLNTAGEVHRITGKSRPAVLADIVHCALKYGAGFNDYLLCAFYDLTEAQRATYVTRSVNNRLVSLLNDPAAYHYFDLKTDFYRRFPEYLGREWLDFSQADREAFRAFMAGRDAVIVKPNDLSGGFGVDKLKPGDFPDLDAMYDKLKADNIGVVEEVLTQHPEMNRMFPGAVNTLRLVTILNDSGVHLVYAFIRIGNSDRPVDNLHSGGMFAPIDPETGRVCSVGYDKARRTYERHPATGTEILGFQIPYWRESVALCEQAARVVPQMRYVGWDICVTPTGPVLVEGNNFPGYDILQMPPHTPDKIGMLPRFREFVDI